jgi:hypothetical protein
MNFIADAAGPCRPAVDKKGHVRAERSRQRKQLAPGFFKMKEPVESPQSRGGVAAAAAEPGADGNIFPDMDAERLARGALPEQELGRLISQVPFARRHPRMIASDGKSRGGMPEHFRPRDLDFIVQADGDHDRVQEMITVAPLPHHPQR